jgi:hypothetical protein
MTWEATMRKTILGAAAVLAIGATSAGVLIANAQPAPPPATQDAQPAPPPATQDAAPPARPHWMGWMRGQHLRALREGRPAPGTFALVYRQQDRALAPADVQKIAEGFLLWNGNHTWKVVDVAPAADGSIGFALATPEGSVIARFAMDPHSGRVTRAG